MAGVKKLPKRQKAILEFVRNFIGKNKFPPSLRQIGHGVGISSTSVVNYNLNHLEEKGYLTREKQVSRGLRLSHQAPDLVPAGGLVRIPLAGPIVAGEPVEIGERVFDEEDAIELPRDMLLQHDKLYALEVRGDSMIDAMVKDGDFVIVRHQQEARDGDMVAAWLTDRDETTLKYFFKEQDQIRLQPANPTMGPLYVNPAVVQIQGKVLMVVRQLN